MGTVEHRQAIPITGHGLAVNQARRSLERERGARSGGSGIKQRWPLFNGICEMGRAVMCRTFPADRGPVRARASGGDTPAQDMESGD